MVNRNIYHLTTFVFTALTIKMFVNFFALVDAYGCRYFNSYYLGYVQMHGNANNNNDNGKQTSPSNDMKILNVTDLRYQPSYAELQNQAFQGDTYNELHDRIPVRKFSTNSIFN